MLLRSSSAVIVLDALCGTSSDFAGRRRWLRRFASSRACLFLSLSSRFFLSLLSFVGFVFICLPVRSRHLRRPIQLRTTGLASLFERGRLFLGDLTWLFSGIRVFPNP